MKKLLLLLSFVCSFGSAFASIDSAGCVGSTTDITPMFAGWTTDLHYWASGDPSIAIIDSFTGIAHSIAPGVAPVYAITFSGDTIIRSEFHVYEGLGTITGQDTICTGVVTSLTPTASGGSWYTSDAAVATVDAVTGAVTGLAGGVVNIRYFNGGACAMHTMRVVGAHANMWLTGSNDVCAGAVTTFSAGATALTGGIWTTSNAAIATVSQDAAAGYPLGNVRGLAAGFAYISYSVPSGIVIAGCVDIQVYYSYVSVGDTVAQPIIGNHTLCIGTTDTLMVPGMHFGVWSSTGGVSMVEGNPLSGDIAILTGLTAGPTVITYMNGVSFCADPATFTVSVVASGAPAGVTITGPSSLCAGSTMTLTPSVPGGIWHIPPAYSSFASIDAAGVVSGISAGAVSGLTYSVDFPSCGTISGTHSFTVVAPPVLSPIYASSPFMCLGSTVTLSDTLGGGTWHSSDLTIISLGGTAYWSTVASPLTPGTATITYTYTGMCASTPISLSATATYTTSGPVSAGVVSGPSSVCDGTSFSLSSSSTGGVWSSATPVVATIDAGGMVHTSSAGTAIISYEVTGVCNSSVVTDTIEINAVGAPGTISGATSVMAGYTIPLTASVAGGTWSVSSSLVASVNVTTGVLSGLSTGTVVVTYTPAGCYAPAYVTYTVTVVPADEISGSVYFAPTSYTGNIRVWLIAYNAPMLTAIDSVDVYSPGSNAAYQFLNEPAGTYRIKAAPLDGPLTGTGFIPTYYISSLYWNTADVITHATASVNAGVNINLMTGTVTTGPGFIGGDVTTGANKGTTDGAPVNNLMMYLLDATNTLYQSTRTDATGHYSFSNIPPGTYYVFPDSMNYATVPYTGINITSGSPSVTNARFIQHTLSHIISPIPVGISNVAAINASVIMFPNPTSGKVTIAWQLPAAQHATIMVADITGRVVTNNTLNMASGAGNSELNLSNLVNGLYTISVKSADISYTTKIQVQH